MASFFSVTEFFSFRLTPQTRVPAGRFGRRRSEYSLLPKRRRRPRRIEPLEDRCLLSGQTLVQTVAPVWSQSDPTGELPLDAGDSQWIVRLTAEGIAQVRSLDDVSSLLSSDSVELHAVQGLASAC
jgi:hypothetical protein